MSHAPFMIPYTVFSWGEPNFETFHSLRHRDWALRRNLELWVLVVAAFTAGAAAATIVVGFAWLRGWVLVRRFKKATKKLEKELHELRSLPLSGSAGAALDADPTTALTANVKHGKAGSKIQSALKQA